VIRWHVGFYPTTLLEIAIVATVAAFGLETFLGHRSLEWRTPFTFPALAFVLAGAIAVVAAPDHTKALGLYRAYLLEPIALAYVLANVVSSSRRAAFVLAGFGAAGVVVGVANSVVVLDALRRHAYQVTVTPPVVIYLTANATALFLVPLIAVAGSVLLHGADRRERILSALFLLAAIPSVLLSFSRGGYLALAAVAVGLALSHERRRWLLGGTLAAAVLLLLIPPIGARIAVQLQNGYGNTVVGPGGRLALWSATLQMLRQHLIFGAGLSGFAQRMTPFWNSDHPNSNFIDPHNIVLNFWVETGLLGVIVFAWIMVVAFRTTWRGWRRGPAEWRPIQLGVLLAIVAVVTHGLVDVPYFKNDLSLEFWALIGLSVAGIQLGMAPGQSVAKDGPARAPTPLPRVVSR
jgi:O-antigen ligase